MALNFSNAHRALPAIFTSAANAASSAKAAPAPEAGAAPAAPKPVLAAPKPAPVAPKPAPVAPKPAPAPVPAAAKPAPAAAKPLPKAKAAPAPRPPSVETTVVPETDDEADPADMAMASASAFVDDAAEASDEDDDAGDDFPADLEGVDWGWAADAENPGQRKKVYLAGDGLPFVAEGSEEEEEDVEVIPDTDEEGLCTPPRRSSRRRGTKRIRGRLGSDEEDGSADAEDVISQLKKFADVAGHVPKATKEAPENLLIVLRLLLGDGNANSTFRRLRGAEGVSVLLQLFGQVGGRFPELSASPEERLNAFFGARRH